jgi:hypothetical protein
MPVSPAPCPRVQRWPPKPVPRSLLMLRPNFHQSAAFAALNLAVLLSTLINGQALDPGGCGRCRGRILNPCAGYRATCVFAGRSGAWKRLITSQMLPAADQYPDLQIAPPRGGSGKGVLQSGERRSS